MRKVAQRDKRLKMYPLQMREINKGLKMDGINDFLILAVGIFIGFLLTIIIKELIDLYGTGGFVETKRGIDTRMQWRPPARGEVDVPIDFYLAHKKLESRLEFLEQMAFEKNLNENKKG